MAKKQTAPQYDNQSITMLKGADRVRKRPAVIFGSDGLEGCELLPRPLLLPLPRLLLRLPQLLLP